MRQIKVLVVEDSIVFRELLVNGINADPALTVVAVAENAYEARDAILSYRPDVMTLDVELPRMSGIEFLRRLLPQYAIPVVVVSSLNASVFDALEAGAVDFVNKPQIRSAKDIEVFVKQELNTKIKIASTAKLGKSKYLTATIRSNDVRRNYSDAVIAIGASTGGTEAIFAVIDRFDVDIPGVVVVQHMPPGFTAMYAERLNHQCRVVVKEARTGDRVLPGQVLISPGDKHMRLTKVGERFQVECFEGPKVSGHCPSVDVLFESVAKVAGERAVGVLLTGMGADGAKGLLKMKESGQVTIGQNEASCVVYGMPRVAYEIGAVNYQVGLDNIANKVYSILDTL